MAKIFYRLMVVMLLLTSLAGCGSGGDSSGVAVEAKTVTIGYGSHFSFVEGRTTGASGGDMVYSPFSVAGVPAGMTIRSVVEEGSSGNYGNSYNDFANWASQHTFLPPSWYPSETVYLFDGSFDGRGRWTRWIKTADHKYAILFVEAATSEMITFKYVYPYGAMTW